MITRSVDLIARWPRHVCPDGAAGLVLFPYDAARYLPELTGVRERVLRRGSGVRAEGAAWTIPKVSSLIMARPRSS